MKKTQSQNTFLPLIFCNTSQKNTRNCNIYTRSISQLNFMKENKTNSITRILREVRESMNSNIEGQKSLQKQNQRKEQKKKKRQSFLTKKQKNIYFDEVTNSNENNIIPTRETMRKISSMVPNSVQISSFKPLLKPPHRSKTAMCIDGDKIYVYGGLGCQPNLKLAVFDIQTKKWNFSTEEKFGQYHPSVPITGHSFASYKGKGYIYGGKSTDIMNELSVVNFKDQKFTEGQRCQFRRKQHAMTMISKFMVIHGGIEANQISNQMFFYNTQTNTWIYPVVSPTMPFLYNHSMTSTYPLKTKKKQINSFSEIFDPIFIFGGHDKKGNLSNALYKVSFQNDTFVAAKVQFTGSLWPEQRMQMAFHNVGCGYLLLYGGKMAESQDEENFYHRQNNVYAYHTEKQQWSKLASSQLLQDHHGMASVESNGKVYIFGGLQNGIYSNGNIITLTTWTSDFIRSKSNFGTRNILANNGMTNRQYPIDKF